MRWALSSPFYGLTLWLGDQVNNPQFKHYSWYVNPGLPGFKGHNIFTTPRFFITSTVQLYSPAPGTYFWMLGWKCPLLSTMFDLHIITSCELMIHMIFKVHSKADFALRKSWGHFSSSPVVKTLPPKAGAAGLIPDQGAKNPGPSWPRNQNIK